MTLLHQEPSLQTGSFVTKMNPQKTDRVYAPSLVPSSSESEEEEEEEDEEENGREETISTEEARKSRTDYPPTTPMAKPVYIVNKPHLTPRSRFAKAIVPFELEPGQSKTRERFHQPRTVTLSSNTWSSLGFHPVRRLNLDTGIVEEVVVLRRRRKDHGLTRSPLLSTDHGPSPQEQCDRLVAERGLNSEHEAMKLIALHLMRLRQQNDVLTPLSASFFRMTQDQSQQSEITLPGSSPQQLTSFSSPTAFPFKIYSDQVLPLISTLARQFREQRRWRLRGLRNAAGFAAWECRMRERSRGRYVEDEDHHRQQGSYRIVGLDDQGKESVREVLRFEFRRERLEEDDGHWVDTVEFRRMMKARRGEERGRRRFRSFDDTISEEEEEGQDDVDSEVIDLDIDTDMDFDMDIDETAKTNAGTTQSADSVEPDAELERGDGYTSRDLDNEDNINEERSVQ